MTDRLTPAMLRDLADVVQSFDTLLAASLRREAARREAETPTRTDAMRQIAQEYGFGSRTPTLDALDLTKKPDAPPPPAPFVTDHKWLDPECHASGCQTLILKAEIEKLRDQRDKYVWQVRDTCRRAEAAEAREKWLRELASAMLAKTSVVLDRPKPPIGEPCVLVEYDAARSLWDALAQGGNDDQAK